MSARTSTRGPTLLRFYSGSLEVSATDFTDDQILAEAVRRKLVRRNDAPIANAARALVERLQNLSTEDFSAAGEAAERNALAALLDMPIANPERLPYAPAAINDEQAEAGLEAEAL